MAEFPALPLWTDAYLGDTTHLSAAEHGSYLLLLIVAWRTPTTDLPDDDRLLAKYTKCTSAGWPRMRKALAPFFKIEGGRWVQLRLLDEKKNVERRRSAAAANGRASALKRQGRHSTERDAPYQRSDQRSVNETPTPLNLNLNHIQKEEGESAAQIVAAPRQPLADGLRAWNETALRIGWPQVINRSPARDKMLGARLREHGLDGWKAAIARASQSIYLGRDPPTWFTFDWLIKPTNFAKLMDGNYDRQRSNGESGDGLGKTGQAVADILAIVHDRKASTGID